ncbi:DnaT-like ssDNA-binding domain-containing protein [Marinobacterium jannaschii]|uniref:DnaT-like ssDNA-binding domain-containing protein n=1 Tax=Marinobacterium jannaschii TaxID=64970 RepID=UPI000688DFD3|nr:DnaT-like ssDNA-binding domain-containing protein [Marinobacterium jannaschii]
MSISMPEQPLLVYPSLVARFGLEESLLLGCYQRFAELTGSDSETSVVVTLSRQQWLRLVPFWDEEKLAVLTNSLVIKQALEAAFEGDIVTLEILASGSQEPQVPATARATERGNLAAAADDRAVDSARAESGFYATAAEPEEEPPIFIGAAQREPADSHTADHRSAALFADAAAPAESADIAGQPTAEPVSAEPLQPGMPEREEPEPPLLNVPVQDLPDSSPQFDRPVSRLLAEEMAAGEPDTTDHRASLLDDLVPGRESGGFDSADFRVEVEPVDRLPVVEEPPQFMQPVHQVRQPRYPDEMPAVPPPAEPLVPGRGPAPTFGGSTGWARNRQANRARTSDELQEIFQQREVRNQQLHAIFVGWQPSESFFALLPHHGIPEEFARECIDGFILYWLDKDRRETNWDSKFLGWVKREWVHKQTAAGRQQRQEQEQQKGFVNNENTRTDSRAKRQRVTRAIMDIRDTDW